MYELPAFLVDEVPEEYDLAATTTTTKKGTKGKGKAREAAGQGESTDCSWEAMAQQCHEQQLVVEAALCAWLTKERFAFVPLALFDLADPRITEVPPNLLRPPTEAFVWLLVVEPSGKQETRILGAALIQRGGECSYVWARQLFPDPWWQQAVPPYAMELEQVLRAHVEVCCEYDDRLLAARCTGQHVSRRDLIDMLPLPARVAVVLARLVCDSTFDDGHVTWPDQWTPDSCSESCGYEGGGEEVDASMCKELMQLLQPSEEGADDADAALTADLEGIDAVLANTRSLLASDGHGSPEWGGARKRARTSRHAHTV